MRPNAARSLNFGPVFAPRRRFGPEHRTGDCHHTWRLTCRTPWLAIRCSSTGNGSDSDTPKGLEFTGLDASRAVKNYKQIFTLPYLTDEGRYHLEQRKDHDEQVIVSGYGYIVSQKSISKNLLFATLVDENPDREIQIISAPRKGYRLAEEQHQLLKSLNRWTPVYYEGLLQRKRAPGEKHAPVVESTEEQQADERPFPSSISGVQKQSPTDENSQAMEGSGKLPKWLKDLTKSKDVSWQNVRKTSQDTLKKLEIKLDKLVVLNEYPADLHFGEDHVVPPHLRHLQIRNDKKLRNALQFRAQVARSCHNLLRQEKFLEVETPLLFKSTPEGAREFMVPTREKGLAYALPQSPQQYKQILMASGIPRYYQFAKCFRDEDLRADRQPEFTQLDIEMAFATGWHVREVVAKLIKHVWSERMGIDYLEAMRPQMMTYEEAMSKYGSDKPDTRLGMEIMRIEHMIPADLVSKIGPLNDPIVEAFKIELNVDDTKKAQQFISKFMDSPEASTFIENPAGQPGVFIHDTKKPLGGLSPFGFEAAERLEEELELDHGDIVIIQARPNEPFSGGSTPIGNLRLALAKAAAADGLFEIPSDWNWLWISDFPLFTKSSLEDQTMSSNHLAFTPTHHPFTAPATEHDIDLILTDPLSAKADHYDLVLNGVEIGGGSRRIHSAEFQTFILQDVLKLSEERMKDFDHLIGVLRAGCPPHAGFAMGFDRLVKEMLRLESLRDVIAFPKSGSGEDMLVKSPGVVTQEQLDTYHLQLKG